MCFQRENAVSKFLCRSMNEVLGNLSGAAWRLPDRPPLVLLSTAKYGDGFQVVTHIGARKRAVF